MKEKEDLPWVLLLFPSSPPKGASLSLPHRRTGNFDVAGLFLLSSLSLFPSRGQSSSRNFPTSEDRRPFLPPPFELREKTREDEQGGRTTPFLLAAETVKRRKDLLDSRF